jgi:hypothetical protein
MAQIVPSNVPKEGLDIDYSFKDQDGYTFVRIDIGLYQPDTLSVKLNIFSAGIPGHLNNFRQVIYAQQVF